MLFRYHCKQERFYYIISRTRNVIILNRELKMIVEKFPIVRDPEWYEAWPDLTQAADGRLICVFSECLHHDDRSYTRIMMTSSFDGGRSWSPRTPLTESTAGKDYFYNCARISRLRSGMLAITVDQIPLATWETDLDKAEVLIFYSYDNGETWSKPSATPLHGIVPERLTELPSGRLLLAAHRTYGDKLTVFLRHSDDGGMHWSDERILAADPELNLCEASLLPLGGGEVVAFLRENSLRGLDCFKCISRDNGETWSRPEAFPLSCCHRPTAGFLRDGRIFFTYRFCPGTDTQSFFGALADRESVLAEHREDVKIRVIPIDYDRAKRQDTGYSGWAELEDGKVCIVNYIVDDMLDHGQIRGYFLHLNKLILHGNA